MSDQPTRADLEMCCYDQDKILSATKVLLAAREKENAQLKAELAQVKAANAALEKDKARVVSALCGLVGESDPSQLKQMRELVSAAPMAEINDKSAMLNAIDVLIQNAAMKKESA